MAYVNREASRERKAKTAQIYAAREKTMKKKALAKFYESIGAGPKGQFTVPEGVDNWFALAEMLYGDQRYAEQLAAANGFVFPGAGSSITIPGLLPGLGTDLGVSYDFMAASLAQDLRMGYNPDFAAEQAQDLANQIYNAAAGGQVSAQYAANAIGYLNQALSGGGYGAVDLGAFTANPFDPTSGAAPGLFPAGARGGGEAGALPGGLSGGAVGPGAFGGTDTATGSFLNLPGGGVSSGVVPGAAQYEPPPIAGPQPSGFAPSLLGFPGAREASGLPPAPQPYPVPGALPPVSPLTEPITPSVGMGPQEGQYPTSPYTGRSVSGSVAPPILSVEDYSPELGAIGAAFNSEGELVNPGLLPDTIDFTTVSTFFFETGDLSPQEAQELAAQRLSEWGYVPGSADVFANWELSEAAQEAKDTQIGAGLPSYNPYWSPVFLKPWQALSSEGYSQYYVPPWMMGRGVGGGYKQSGGGRQSLGGAHDSGHSGGSISWRMGWE